MDLLMKQQLRLEQLYEEYEVGSAEAKKLGHAANKAVQEALTRGESGAVEERIEYIIQIGKLRDMKAEIADLEASVTYPYKVWTSEMRLPDVTQADLKYMGILVALRRLQPFSRFTVGDELFEVMEEHREEGLLYVVALGTVHKGYWKEERNG